MPVFNDSTLLEKSITSFLNQTLDNIELICIDDGSTDDSLKVLKNYSKKYDSIKVFSQENQGSGKARNYGISKAKGEYIGFLDADDFFIDNNGLEKLYEAAIKNDANMVTGNIKLVNSENEFSSFTYLEYYTDYDVIEPQQYGIPWSFYKNIYKTEFLRKNNIIFPDLIRGQDPVFLAEVLSKIDMIYTVPIDFYAYFYIDGFKKINTDAKIFDHIMHYKMVFDYLNDPKFQKVIHDFKHEMMIFFDNIDSQNIDKVLKIVREIFANNMSILKNIEEFFYSKFYNAEINSKIINKIATSNHPRISVIFKIKNNKKNLKNSIDNILLQTLQDIELICINDNSYDGSLDIMERIAEKDSRVSIIDNVDRDFGTALKKALNLAKGEYIFFFNPYLCISRFILLDLYKNAIFNDSDMVLFKTNPQLFDSENLLPYNFDEIIECEDIRRTTFDYTEVKSYVLNSELSSWFKLYKKEFLLNYDFLLNSSNPFNYMILHVKSFLKAKYISFSPVNYYFFEYPNNPSYFNSIDIFQTIDHVESILNEENLLEEFKENFKLFKIYYILNYLDSSKSEEYFQLSKKELSKLNYNINLLPYSIFKKYNWVLQLKSFKDYEYECKIDNDSKTYDEYILKKELNDLNMKEKELLKKNYLLQEQIKNNKKFTKNILSSNSFKILKPFKKLKTK